MSKLKSKGNSEILSLLHPPSSIPISSASATSYSGVIARSPSHESFATDLSLMSLSSLGSEIGRIRSTVIRSRPGSGTDSGDDRRSPIIMEGAVGGWLARSSRANRSSNSSLLQVPQEQYGTNRSVTDDVLYEEENEAIRNCGALSSMLGLMRSFSTSDLEQGALLRSEQEPLRASVSETLLSSWKHNDMPYRLEYTSRSCSTWVAVGDISTTSQLPSPQTLAGYATQHPELTAVDFVRAINKKVRQMYIRRRLESTYRALERLTRSELSLDLPSIPIPAISTNKSSPISREDSSSSAVPESKGATANNPASTETSSPIPYYYVSTELDRSIRHDLQLSSLGFKGANRTLSLTVNDIERDKGKPLSKFARNMMIFNWLQSLDENSFDQLG